MTNYRTCGDLQVSDMLATFIESEVLNGLDYATDDVWTALSNLITDNTPKNIALLDERADLQAKIQSWQRENQAAARDGAAQIEYLRSIGYLSEPAKPFTIATDNVDEEISTISGPQLVVPVSNARYALNAANARWGSLYDALYGTDAIMPPPEPGPYSTERGNKVIAWAKQFLDETWPLEGASHADIEEYGIDDQGLYGKVDGSSARLTDPQAFIGFAGNRSQPSAILLIHNGLHAEIAIDRGDTIGSTDKAGVKDIYMDAALTSIIDFEDSVAAVDGEDKTECYRNWLGLVRGDLTASFMKGGQEQLRTLAPDRVYTTVEGESVTLSGRSRLLVRNVGHLMTTPAVLDSGGEEVFEGLIDAFITSLIACHGLKNGTFKSVYIVKPKMHGPKECAFANNVLDQVEDALGLQRYTLKIGLMDEERRTSANLAECIFELRNRIIFINTGFLDRTGDEIHTALEAGPVMRKGEMPSSDWLPTYEAGNVLTGLNVGFQGRAQIGKGMWAKPDYMAAMVDEKIAHPKAGADCAWVPSPTAATLHALHYHKVNVDEVQTHILNNASKSNRQLKDLLTPPVAENPNWSDADKQAEIDNCCQGILGYVVRWIDHGVGCSKVPDIHDVGLMEDRATLRISCQLLGNWLHHGVCTRNDVEEALLRMAAVVDRQNAGDPAYQPMATNPDASIAFKAARDLVLKATEQPSGYTEPLLHKARLARKAELARA